MLYNIVAFLFIVSFYYAGLKFPDIDFKLRNFGITHRSMLTHSFFVPAFLMLLNAKGILGIYWQRRYDISGIIIVSFSVGIIMHLLYDLFPKKFAGTALIQIPFFQAALKKSQTVAWILASCIILTGISVFYPMTMFNIATFIACIVLTLCFKKNEENGFYAVAILFAVIFFLAAYFRNDYVDFIIKFFYF